MTLNAVIFVQKIMRNFTTVIARQLAKAESGHEPVLTADKHALSRCLKRSPSFFQN